MERLGDGPVQIPLGAFHFLRSKGRAVGRGCILLVRASIRDVRAHHYEGGPRIRLCRLYSGFDPIQIVAVCEALHVPPICFEAAYRVVAVTQRGFAVDGDMVVIVKTDQPAEPEVSGE